MEKEIAINGTKITYFDEGEGFPILIIHGWGPWLTVPYVKFRELLVSHGYRVIFLSLPGFGKSSDPSFNWGMDEYLASILAFIDQLNLEKFFLVGHSMGGAMSIRLAVSHPERIKALVLLAPGVFGPYRFLGINVQKARLATRGFSGYLMLLIIVEKFFSLVSTIMENFSFFGISLLRSEKVRNRLEGKLEKIFKKINGWLTNFWKPQKQFFFQKNKLMSKILKNIMGVENLLPYFSKIKHPTLVLWGENDYILLSLCGRFMGRIPNSEFKLIPETGHNLQEEAPEKIVELMMNFIKKLDK